MSMSETSTCGGSIEGDSDSSLLENARVCRDFMRNVCNRKQCRFLHPENTKVRTDPIFCHDFQIEQCFRTNCKFIHCTKQEEDSFRKTGELPPGVSDPEAKARTRNGGGGVGATRNCGSRNNNKTSSTRVERGVENEMAPICKDFLKGVCDRGGLRGCKYRHVNPRRILPSSTTPQTYGPPVMVRGRGGVRMMMAPVVSNNNPSRKHPRPSSDELYEDHQPQPKRFHGMGEYYDGLEEEEDYELMDPMVPPPPPARGQPFPFNQDREYSGYYNHQNGNGGCGTNLGYVAMGNPNPPLPSSNRNGVISANYSQHYNHNSVQNNHHLNQQDSSMSYYQTPVAATQADTIKSLEDENFMLKRRIEELKSSNEFLLSQNAQLRLNSTLTVGTSVAQVAPLSVSAVSVSAAGLTSAQPSIIGITSSSLTGSQPLPTISISTLPTPISISQTSQPQIYLPAPQN